MKPGSRRPWAVLSTLLLLFGLACLNYTKVAGLEYRRAWAERHELPPPGRTIYYGGLACVVIGSGLLGFLFGQLRDRK